MLRFIARSFARTSALDGQACILKAVFVLLGWGVLFWDLLSSEVRPKIGPMSRKLANSHGRVSNGEPKLSRG